MKNQPPPPSRAQVRAYEDLYDLCIEPTVDDLNKWKSQPAFAPRYKTKAFFFQYSTFLLAELVPSLASAPAHLRDPLCLTAVYETFLSKRRSIVEFQRSGAKLGEALKKRPLKQCTAWVHLDVGQPPTFLKALTIDRQPLELVPIKELTQRCAKQKLSDFVQQHGDHVLHKETWLLKASIKAHSKEEALAALLQLSEIVRGTMNFTANNRTTLTLTGTKETCHHYPPLIYATMEADDEPQLLSGYGASKAKRNPIPDADEETVKEILRFFEPQVRKSTVRKLLAESLILANAGYDNIYPAHQFLSLWVAMERLALVDSGSTVEVRRRLVHLWENGPESELPAALEQLSKIRNRLVHEGVYEHEADGALLWLRFCFAQCWRRLFRLSKDLKTVTSLSQFYSAGGQSVSSLRDRAKGLEIRIRAKQESVARK
jgi:hypothetical protein